MRIHHSSCISACPLGGHLLDSAGSRAPRDQLACHCLLLEEGGALVLVDTGYGLRDVAAPRAASEPNVPHDTGELEASSHRSMRLPLPPAGPKLTNGGSAHPAFSLRASWD